MSITRISLFKRANGKWYILYTQDGLIHWKSTGEILKSNALQKLTHFQKLFQCRVGSKTLSQFFRDFLSVAQANYSKRTFNSTKLILHSPLKILDDLRRIVRGILFSR